LRDYLHVPYRKALIPHCDQVFVAARQEGAYGATISGSGSTLIAYCTSSTVEAVAKAMGRVYQEAGIGYHVYCLKADSQGAKILD
jgi:homoserine kinase